MSISKTLIMLASLAQFEFILLPGNFCSGIPFALKGDWQLGNRMIFVLFLAKFQSHLAWQSQCNGLPSSCNKLSFTTTSSFKTRFLRLQCSKLRDSKPDSIPVKELEGNSENEERKWQSIFWQLNQYVKSQWLKINQKVSWVSFYNIASKAG